MGVSLPIVDSLAPTVALDHLDQLWFQVGGTVCNLECRHCFISCSPHNHSFEFLGIETVRRALEDSVPLGVKEYYFTGGEPFLNPDMTAIAEMTLGFGPATILTNATVLKPQWLKRLQEAEARSVYSLEFRVSIDGPNAPANDPIRGDGSFDRALQGVRLLLEYGFLPLVTVAAMDENGDPAALFEGFVKTLKEHGYARPRVKMLPALRLGAEEDRYRGYRTEERVTADMMEGFDQGQLLCSHSRIVTNRGVYVCPILIESPDARLGATLKESQRPFALRHHACYTCYQFGALCANPSGGFRDA